MKEGFYILVVKWCYLTILIANLTSHNVFDSTVSQRDVIHETSAHSSKRDERLKELLVKMANFSLCRDKSRNQIAKSFRYNNPILKY